MEKEINTKGNNLEEQNENLKKMNYPKKEDIFYQNESIPLDKNGEPLEDSENKQTKDMGLDVPGSEYDNQMEEIGAEDEENNYYSSSDQD